jgi:hypothetical protein
MADNPSGSCRVSDGVVFRELDGEAVLLNLDSGMYFGLDRVGTRVWQLIEEHGRLDAVVERLLEEYDVAPDVLRADVATLVTALVDKGLVVVAAEVPPGT